MRFYVQNFEETKQRVTTALRQKLFSPSIHVDRGMRDHLFITIVSEEFNGKTEDEKQDLVWKILDDELKEEAQAVALVTPLGMDEV